MRRDGFTLIELLVVVAIMGLLGTISVGGYRQMQRGMEERGVMQNVNEFLRNAYQRAQIDRTPVELYFWNETTRSQSDDGDEVELVHGRAVAVRRHGRVSMIDKGPKGGDLLVDEFSIPEPMDSDGFYIEAPDNDSTMRLYQMNSTDSSKHYSMVYSVPRSNAKDPEDGGVGLDCVSHDPKNDGDIKNRLTYGTAGRLIVFGYEVKDQGSANAWANSMAYGMEFLTLDLPEKYIFGTDYSKRADSEPVKGEEKLVYKPSDTSPKVVTVYHIRPGSGGQLSAQKVSTADNPSKQR